MSVVLRASVDKSACIDRRIQRDTDECVGDVLSDIARMLWPTCTAACLAAEIGKLRGKEFSTRSAERYLAGHDWSGEAVAVVVAEIMRRYGMRNVRVAARP